MTDVQSFSESQKYEKSNVIIKIVKIGIEKNGEFENHQTWKGRRLTIQDQTGLIKVTMSWGEQWKSFQDGKSYKVYDLTWEDYKGSPQPQLSTVTKIEQIEVQTKIETKIPESEPEIALSSDEFLKSKQKEIRAIEEKFNEKIQSLMRKYPEFVTKTQTGIEKLLILDSMINESLTKDDNILPNVQKVGLWTKILNEVND